MTPDQQPAKKAAAKKKPAAAKPAAPVEPAEPIAAAALDELDTSTLEDLVDDDTQPRALRDEAREVLEQRRRDGAVAELEPEPFDHTDEAGARLALVRAIAAAMADVGRVVKDRTNTDHHYKFASVEAMLKAVRGPLYRRGVLLIARPGGWDERPVEAKSGNRGTVVDLTLDFLFTNGAADLEIHGWHGQGVDYSDKAGSKAYTSALKTFVRVQWLLPAEMDDDPDRSSPEGYGKPPTTVERPPAWAAAASDADKAAMLTVLTELLGDRAVAIAAAKQLAERTGGFPSVFAKWLAAFPMFISDAAKVAQARADEARAAQDRAAEAPDTAASAEPLAAAALAEGERVQAELIAKLDAEQPDPEAPQCGARRGELVCVRRPGHVHRGDAQHITSTGQGFPDDDHITYGPAPDDGALFDQPPTAAPAPVDGPDVGSVRVDGPAAGETTDSYLLRLRVAGCTCPDPTGDNLDTINCPIDGHGIPY